MSKDVFYTLGGAIIGSIIEEGIEEMFPSPVELGVTGEIAGAITGLLKSKFDKAEAKEALITFVRYVFRQINKQKLDSDLSEEEIKLFTKNFQNLPKNIKSEILSNYKNIDPYNYSLIKEYLVKMEGKV